MNMPNDKLAAGFDEARYPADFLLSYEPIECLSLKQETKDILIIK